MNIKEKIEKNNSFIISLEDYYGSGWANQISNIIIEIIKPKSYKKSDIEAGWSFSEYEIIFEKDNLNVKIEIDDLGPIALILKQNINEESKQKLREWAIIIAEEIEKLKNK